MGMETERDFVNQAMRGIESKARAPVEYAVRLAMAAAWERGAHYCSRLEGGERVVGLYGVKFADVVSQNPYVDNAKVSP